MYVTYNNAQPEGSFRPAVDFELIHERPLEVIPYVRLAATMLNQGVNDSRINTWTEVNRKRRGRKARPGLPLTPIERMREDARGWLLSDSERPYGFAWCCRLLGRDPTETRAKAFTAPRTMHYVPLMT